ncbi:MAG: cobyric acid synthase [Nitrospira sp. SB0677_bin_15]|nr:cobyric acid synthase [Nitrospira sp. SB0661_bin_20]MYG39383.1 cobyric acid synthase [Nitrospira sp. SB0677_bin_15]MYH01029.1 cobyric acid synthase [Nitrospira sp. SB0675_bin_23]MYJ23760.1 cobyric acid synthase [Nitrospira sp. SB0673_bin_12]
MAKALAILGTGSDVGKSLLTAGFGRIFHRSGILAAPFKSQNMSLNSFVTVEGGEMGRAQVLQAQACGLRPHVDMNPILLKPEADRRSQVIVQGKVWRTQDAGDYFDSKAEMFRYVRESYERLASHHELILIEGAGSAAEVNLRERDIVNWPVVRMADAEVILVADIDRGGVFAQVIGTLDLLEPYERERVFGIVINKFRGDRRLFDEGVAIIEKRTGIPVLGVLPFLRDLVLDQEDSVAIETDETETGIGFAPGKVNVAVILLPRMSNFTDFNALSAEPDVALRYARSPKEVVDADVLILPGSKRTIQDLEYVKGKGFGPVVASHVLAGREVVGLCGGFQMLGERIDDFHQVEGGGQTEGFRLLPVETRLHREKQTRQVQAEPLMSGMSDGETIQGYEIHVGLTSRRQVGPCFRILDQDGDREDGAVSPDGLVWGTYIHGVFDAPSFRRSWINRVRVRKGLAPNELADSESVTRRLTSALDEWADHVARHVDMKTVCEVLRLPAA